MSNVTNVPSNFMYTPRPSHKLIPIKDLIGLTVAQEISGGQKIEGLPSTYLIDVVSSYENHVLRCKQNNLQSNRCVVVKKKGNKQILKENCYLGKKGEECQVTKETSELLSDLGILEEQLFTSDYELDFIPDIVSFNQN